MVINGTDNPGAAPGQSAQVEIDRWHGWSAPRVPPGAFRRPAALGTVARMAGLRHSLVHAKVFDGGAAVMRYGATEPV